MTWVRPPLQGGPGEEPLIQLGYDPRGVAEPSEGITYAGSGARSPRGAEARVGRLLALCIPAAVTDCRRSGDGPRGSFGLPACGRRERDGTAPGQLVGQADPAPRGREPRWAAAEETEGAPFGRVTAETKAAMLPIPTYAPRESRWIPWPSSRRAWPRARSRWTSTSGWRRSSGHKACGCGRHMTTARDTPSAPGKPGGPVGADPRRTLRNPAAIRHVRQGADGRRDPRFRDASQPG